jgi:hypothetical protein
VRFPIALIVALATAIIGAASASGQVSDDIVRIGVLNDQSGLYADLGGPGSVVAARMAIEDAGGAVLGKPVEVVSPITRISPISGRPLPVTGSMLKKWTWPSASTIRPSRLPSNNSRQSTIGSPLRGQ